MGVTKQTLTPGNQADIPQKGDTVSIHYTGCLYDPNKPEEMYMGSQSVPHPAGHILYAYGVFVLC